jgi:hypothetical protein|tara:strand:- start:869 stop:1069 length:201 start_codon:yes stop_codon:yes gene_type:complete
MNAKDNANANVNIYLELVAAYFAVSSEENANAVDSFVMAHPEVVDDAYVAAGPLAYEIVSGTVCTT